MNAGSASPADGPASFLAAVDALLGAAPVENLSLFHHRCPLACRHCGWRRPGAAGQGRRESSTDEWLRILEWAAQRGVRHLTFTGGEVSEREDFHRLVVEAQWRGLRVVTETNGLRFRDADYCRLFAPGRGLTFVVALHADSAAVHDRVTRVPGSFAATVEGVRNLRTLTACRVELQSVLSRFNVGSAVGLLRLGRTLGVHGHSFTLAILRGLATPDLLPTAPRLAAALRDVLAERAALETAGEAVPEVCFNNVPLCLLDAEIARSLNYPGSPGQVAGGRGDELMLHPAEPERSYLARRALPMPLDPPESCVGCFLRETCPAPSYLAHLSGAEAVVRPFAPAATAAVPTANDPTPNRAS